MFSFFKLSPTKIREQQLHDNRVSLLQHKQAAAYHAAMTNYLSGEVDRLSADVAAEKQVSDVDKQVAATPQWVIREMRSKGRDQETSTLWAEPRAPRSTRDFTAGMGA